MEPGTSRARSENRATRPSSRCQIEQHVLYKRYCKTISEALRAAPGIGPGTSRALSENHATRPSSHLLTRVACSSKRTDDHEISPIDAASCAYGQAGYSSVGRASDCRLLQKTHGPLLDSGWPDFVHITSLVERRICQRGLRRRNSPTCTLSQNGYGARSVSKITSSTRKACWLLYCTPSSAHELHEGIFSHVICCSLTPRWGYPILCRLSGLGVEVHWSTACSVDHVDGSP